MTNNYYPKSLFYPNNYYIVLYYITITISFNYIIFTTFQFVFLSIFVFPCHITASYNHVIISYYCASDFLSVNTVYIFLKSIMIIFIVFENEVIPRRWVLRYFVSILYKKIQNFGS